MNEQMLEQQSEEALTLEVSDEALEAAADNGLRGPDSNILGGPYTFALTFGCR